MPPLVLAQVLVLVLVLVLALVQVRVRVLGGMQILPPLLLLLP